MAYPAKPDYRTLSRRCHGYGTLECRCGGDMCVCGLDGEQCLGCPDCEGQPGEEDDDYPACNRCGDELASDGSCYQCDPACSYCHERPCIGICPTSEPDGEPRYNDDGHPY